MGVQLQGCILQSYLHQNRLTQPARESSPNMGSLSGKKAVPEILFFLNFLYNVSRSQVACWGYGLQMKALAESYRVWQTGRGKFGVRMLGEIWQRFGQASSGTWCILPWSLPGENTGKKHYFLGLHDRHSVFWEEISELVVQPWTSPLALAKHS